ncbi:MAG: 1-acyl-sn-glycerol-3-phosphate acyltransferase [Methyloversatilis discipulorum]|uniref:lysophospholipid acyltransferase family protein n=1 Tax=Methyloversatilis discipulorum TaxID=1119528 RepID=UPI0026F049FE|nr:lysophospholipid acyltransferase family protein [Methyloversatilis discipulorum]MBT9518362.1 1-acyl-sn-glycerol-3-phosphate acyltransferase [Methyloversatilis discipulorum]
MPFVRSLLFFVFLFVITPPFSLIAIVARPLPPHVRYRLIGLWTHLTMFALRIIVGLRHRVIGSENLPKGKAVVLCKHQSAWETMALQVFLPPVAFVFKRELLRIPFFGWGLGCMPMIAIDRGAGKDALKQVEEQGARLLDLGFWVTVFPEGTRMPPGQTKRYKIGGARLAEVTGAPVVPIAHNAGDFWKRNAFLKLPGEITVSIGPAIDTQGLTAEQINGQAQAWIESEMRRLFPHHYGSNPQPAAA